MLMTVGGLTAECDCVEAPRVSQRMLYILNGIKDVIQEPSNVIIHYKPEKIYYQIVDGVETKFSSELTPIQQ